MRAVVGYTGALGALVVAVLALTGGLRLSPEQANYQAPTGPAPWDYTVATWDSALGGDQELTSASYATLAKYEDPDLGGAVAAVRAIATRVVQADLTGEGQAPLRSLTPSGVAPYWPDPPATGLAPTPQCSEVTLLATSPAALPVEGSAVATLGLFSRFAKVLVAFTGTCTDQVYDTTSPGIRYVYAGLGDDGWVPLRSWQVPSESALDTTPGATEPYDWELTTVEGACQTPTLVRARIAVAQALEQMCQAAAEEDTPLTVTAGYRTRAEQASVFAEAVNAYGSQENARLHVAYADESVCTSKHCSGLAVNVETDDAMSWLTSIVGCVAPDGTVSAANECSEGSTPVPNLARWGFSAPLAVSPGYLEFTLPVAGGSDSSLAAPNCVPAGTPVANQVAAIFRCRLAREGVVGAQQDQVVAEALVISRCESGWNPTAAAFGGRFAREENPVTGRTYTNEGVFMLASDVAAQGWVTGGADAVDDSVANINAAASLWLTTRSWVQFGCATGDEGGFEAGPVLPQYGGPALPQWSSQY